MTGFEQVSAIGEVECQCRVLLDNQHRDTEIANNEDIRKSYLGY